MASFALTVRNGIGQVACPILRKFGTILPRPFRPVGEHGWFAPWPDGRASRPHQTVVCEDAALLHGAESALGVIQHFGYGAYRFAPDGVYFSSSDNTNPNENRRQYRLVSNPLNLFSSHRPVNHRRQRASDAELQREVERALCMFTFVDKYEQATGETLQGKTVLEVGPGPGYGWTMVMACLGATCHVVDPFAPSWSDDYHPRFYRALIERLRADPRVVTIAPLERLLAECDFERAGLVRYVDAVEELTAPAEIFDFIFSMATAEHFYDISAAFQQLARMTRRGGVGFHAIDLRDHRDFSRPLEYLLLSDADFRREFVVRHAECGNRHRASEFLDVLRNVGFDVMSHQGTLNAEESYLRDFLPRLRAHETSRYRDWPPEKLQPTSIDVLLRKH